MFLSPYPRYIKMMPATKVKPHGRLVLKIEMSAVPNKTSTDSIKPVSDSCYRDIFLGEGITPARLSGTIMA